MSRKQDQVTDNAPFGKYFHVMLNMADDDLNPYQYRLLGHYRRVCGDNGACWESTRTTATKCKMSTGKVSSTRKELETTGYIHLQYRDDDTCFITLVDRMAENIQRYCSPDEQRVHDMNGSVHQVKQRKTNEEKPNKKKTVAAKKPPQRRTPEPQSYAERHPELSQAELDEISREAIANITAKSKAKADEATAIDCLIQAMIEANHQLVAGQYANRTNRTNAKALYRSGITPDEVRAYIVDKRRDKWWADNGVGLKNVVENITTWRQSHKPVTPPRPVVTAASTDTPVEDRAAIADLLAAGRRALETDGVS